MTIASQLDVKYINLDYLDVIQECIYFSTNYGPYNLLTNNCHHYVNRVSEMLTSDDCTSGAPGGWASVTRGFWKALGHLSSGTWPAGLHDLWRTGGSSNQDNDQTPTVT